MTPSEYKKFLGNALREKTAQELANVAPASKPGEYTKTPSKRNVGETAYQRSIISAGSHRLEDLGDVTWLDIELPVIFGASARRKSLDLLGCSKPNQLVLCELKYDKPERQHKPNRKPSTDSPVYALWELLTYYYHIIENADRLQKDKIWHKNKSGEWDWTQCKDPKKVQLIVSANETYWKQWMGYTPGWKEIAGEIRSVVGNSPAFPGIRFYSTPTQKKDFTTQAAAKENKDKKGYKPLSLIGEWKEIQI